MNLKNHIRKLLKENNTDKMIKLVGKYVNAMYPKFNEDEVKFDVHENQNGYLTISYFNPDDDTYLATYRDRQRELQLSVDLFNELYGIFGDEMEYVIEWFNYEFGENAEYVTYFD